MDALTQKLSALEIKRRKHVFHQKSNKEEQLIQEIWTKHNTTKADEEITKTPITNTPLLWSVRPTHNLFFNQIFRI